MIVRDEFDRSTNGDPHEIWYRFGGQERGYIGNNGTYDVDDKTSITMRTTSAGAGAFLLGHTEGGTAVSTKFQSDFDQSLDPISSFGRGSTPSSHVVRAGESLSSIAASLWGDSSLWYKLAEANGLSGGAMLSEGQTLRIPAGVMSSAHNASSFTPYDPSEAVANISPSAPKPPKKKGCGGFGQILLVVIAIVVTIYTAGAAATAMGAGGSSIFGAGVSALSGGAGLGVGVAAGAVGGAAGSIASQAVGVATGIQDRFSWNAVALSAIGGAAGAGLAAAGPLAGGGWQLAVARGAVGNAITQGIGVATGLQKEFSWAGVAASAVGAGLGQVLPQGGGVAGAIGRATAYTLANAATRSLIEGTDFGDNIIAALPDVIGQTIGEAIAGGISGRAARAQQAKNASGNELDEFMLDTYGANGAFLSDLAQLDFATMAENASTAMGLPPGTAIATREDGTRIYSLPSQSGRVLGRDNFESWSFDGEGRVIIAASTDFRLSGEITDTEVLIRFTNGAGETSAGIPAWARPGTIEPHDVAEIGGGVWFVGPARGDPLSQFAAGAVRTFVGGGNSMAQMGLFALQHPVEAGQSIVDAGGAAWRSTVNTYNMMQTGAGRAQIGAQVSGWANRTGDNLAWHWNNGTIWDGVGQVFGGLALAEVTGGGLLRGPGRVACFVAGTPIHTRDGLKPIEQITLSDFVLSRPQQDGELGERRVVNLVRIDDKPILEIVIAAAAGRTEIFGTTAEHPFWVEGEGWVAASELKADDRIRLANGDDACIASIRDTGTTATVFNFEVDGWHTYHVGKLGVWVHNADCFGPRNLPGVVTVSGELVPQAGRWLDAATPAPIPAQVAADLAGREFANFGQLRSAVWESIANNPQLRTGFGAQSLGNMRGGFAPFAPLRFQTGLGAFNQRFNLHHIKPIGQGGAVYDLSNIQIVSPRVHRTIHGG